MPAADAVLDPHAVEPESPGIASPRARTRAGIRCSSPGGRRAPHLLPASASNPGAKPTASSAVSGNRPDADLAGSLRSRPASEDALDDRVGLTRVLEHGESPGVAVSSGTVNARLSLVALFVGQRSPSAGRASRAPRAAIAPAAATTSAIDTHRRRFGEPLRTPRRSARRRSACRCRRRGSSGRTAGRTATTGTPTSTRRSGAQA